MVCEVAISDHELILNTRIKGPIIRERCTFYGRSYRNFDNNVCREKKAGHNWNDMPYLENAELKMGVFPWSYNKNFGSNVPYKKNSKSIKLNNHGLPLSCWN